jgi:hypothetical protein
MSKLLKLPLKDLRVVGPEVGSVEMVGACEIVGANEGEVEIEGDELCVTVGFDDTVGFWDGITYVGCDEIVGLELGADEIVGCDEGAEDGSSLCGKAPTMRKSDAVAEVVLATARTFSMPMFAATDSGIPPLPSKFITAMPVRS